MVFQYAAFAMAAFGAAGAGAALSPLLSGFGSSMLINSLFSNPAASQFTLPNLTPTTNQQTAINNNSTAPSTLAAHSISTSPSIKETTSPIQSSSVNTPHPAQQGMFPFAAAAAAAGAAASFSDPRILSQYSAALSALPSSAGTAPSLFNILSSTASNGSMMEDRESVAGTLHKTLLNELGKDTTISKGTSPESLINDITSKTSSIADLRLKAKKHQEAMGIEDRN